MTLVPVRFAFFACLVSVVSVTAQEERATSERRFLDLSYVADDAATAYEKERLKLDLYLPASNTTFATIVWFHGGGLQGGSKSGAMTVRIAERFARAGIAVAVVNYRLHPKVTFPAYVEDAARSFAWVRRHISEYGGDPRRVFVSGHSAGGYLTALLGFDPRYLRRQGLSTDTIAGIIPVSGQMVTHSTVRKERGIPRTQPVIDVAAPSYHVKAEAPCVLAICGDTDLPGRAAESLYFVEALKAADHPDARYLEVTGRNHSTIVSKIPEPGDVVAQAIVQFVTEHSTAAPTVESGGHRILAADSSKKRIAIIGRDGEIEWEFKIGPLHDLHLLADGNILFQVNWTRLVELNPKTNDVVWEYDAQRMNGNTEKRVEVHAFQRLAGGRTMIAESGRGRIIEVDRDGRIAHEVALQIAQPSPHHDTRLVRKLDNGNYLVSQEKLGIVREYDPVGQVVWEFSVPLFDRQRKGGHGLEAFGNSTFSAIRLANGNTLVATGNGHSVLEVTPEKRIVWELQQNDLPGIQLGWVTTLEALPNGNLVLGNCHAGPNNPQVIEITRDKRVVWSYKDFELFGNALTNSQVLDGNGKATR